MSEEFKRNPAQEELDDVRRIALTQNVRERIVQRLTENGTIPNTQEDRGLLMAALDGMDRTSLGRMKIKVEDKAATAQAQASSMVADILNNLTSKSISNTIAPQERSAPKLPEHIQVTNPVAGEMSIGTQAQSYSEFMARNQDLLHKNIEEDQQ